MYEKEILEVYQHCGIRSFPVDCDKILETFGFKVITYKDAANGDPDELRRMKAISNDGDVVAAEATLYINETCYEKRKVFTKAHEIGHLVLFSDIEDDADNFASNLLAPRPIVYAEMLKTADDIAAYFGISIAAANRVVMDMKKFDIKQQPNQSHLEILKHFGYREQFPSLFINYVSPHNLEPSPFILRLLQKTDKEKEQEKKKKIRSLQGKIQRLQKKLVETRDEAEWYRTKDKLAEQQMRLDMLLGKRPDDY